MNTDSRFFLALFALGLTFLAGPETAHAYGGPGSVISGIGAFLAAVAALLAALFGFIWFPLKRLYHKIRQKDTSNETVAANEPSE